jgi:hypothetical protein
MSIDMFSLLSVPIHQLIEEIVGAPIFPEDEKKRDDSDSLFISSSVLYKIGDKQEIKYLKITPSIVDYDFKFNGYEWSETKTLHTNIEHMVKFAGVIFSATCKRILVDKLINDEQKEILQQYQLVYEDATKTLLYLNLKHLKKCAEDNDVDQIQLAKQTKRIGFITEVVQTI